MSSSNCFVDKCDRQAHQAAMFSLGIVFEEEVAAKERAVFMGHHLALSLEAVAAWPQDVVEHP